jgi:hypothetical protein
MRTILVFLATGAVLAATACAPTASSPIGSFGSQSSPLSTGAVPKPTATLLRQPIPGAQPHAWLRKGSGTGSLIYVAAYNQVAIYLESGSSPTPIGTITDKVSGAYGLFVDGKRDLFVANSSTITAYRPGTLHPYLVYSDSASPLYVVEDHSGRLYAANRNGTVTEYPPRKTIPDRTLQTPGSEADGINVDDAGNLYVAYRGGSGSSIEKFRPNSTKGTILGMQLDEPQGLQIDHSGNILVVETGSKQVVDIFPPGSTSPSQVIQATGGVTQVVLRAAGDNMYVSNWATDDVYISHYPPGEFQVKIKTGLGGVQGMALSNEAR